MMKFAMMNEYGGSITALFDKGNWTCSSLLEIIFYLCEGRNTDFLKGFLSDPRLPVDRPCSNAAFWVSSDDVLDSVLRNERFEDAWLDYIVSDPAAVHIDTDRAKKRRDEIRKEQTEDKRQKARRY
jgi:hypothetical protein